MTTLSAATLATLPPVKQLSASVIRILGFNPSPMTLQGSNTYLIGTGARRLLVDSGEGKKEYASALEQTLSSESKKLGCTVDIDSVLLTHWHADHIGGVADVSQLCPGAVFYKIPSLYSPAHGVEKLCKPPPERLAVEGGSVQVVPTPGHTDDHFCLFLEEEKAFFTADAILGSGTSVFACYAEYMDSLRKMREYKPAILYPAHGDVVRDGMDRINAIIEHRQAREAQVVSALGECKTDGMTIHELVMHIYAATTPKSLWKAAGVNVFQHIKSLLRDGTAAVVSFPTYSGMDVDYILSKKSDYELLGEGVKADPHMMECIFNGLRVGLAR